MRNSRGSGAGWSDCAAVALPLRGSGASRWFAVAWETGNKRSSRGSDAVVCCRAEDGEHAEFARFRCGVK